MSEKSSSQKIARFLEVVGWLLLIPGTFGLIISFFVISYVPHLFLVMVILPAYIIGCVLLRGYFKHSRARFNKKSAALLWSGSIIFNSIPAVLLTGWAVYVFRDSLVSPYLEPHNIAAINEHLFWVTTIMLGYYQVAGLSLMALLDDLKQPKQP